MVDNESGCSRAHTRLEPAIVSRERPEEAAVEEKIDVDSSAGVASSAGDREGGCVGRGNQGSGSKERSKHSREGVCGFFGILCNGGGEARNGRVDTGSEELGTTYRGFLCAG